MSAEAVAIAILAKAPVAGFAKTRLAGVLGADGAARLQERFIVRTVATAAVAAAGPITIWCDPDEAHPLFQRLAAEQPLRLKPQQRGDLGARMLAAVEAVQGPAIVIGTDCPALSAAHLEAVAKHLHEGADIVLAPAEDGGYVLIAMRRPQPALFVRMTWSTDTVANETRRRIAAAGLTCVEVPPLWDVDRPDDLMRMRREGFGDLLSGIVSNVQSPA